MSVDREINIAVCSFTLVYVSPALISATSLIGMHVEAVFTAQINIKGIFSFPQRTRLWR